jgi:hypothetical protein
VLIGRSGYVGRRRRQLHTCLVQRAKDTSVSRAKYMLLGQEIINGDKAGGKQLRRYRLAAMKLLDASIRVSIR